MPNPTPAVEAIPDAEIVASVPAEKVDAADQEAAPSSPADPESTIPAPDDSEAGSEVIGPQKRNRKPRERTPEENAAFAEIFEAISRMTGAPRTGRMAKLAWLILDYRHPESGRRLSAESLEELLPGVLIRNGRNWQIHPVGGGRSRIDFAAVEEGWRWICEPPRGTVVYSAADGNTAAAKALHAAVLAEKLAGGVHPIFGGKKP